MPRIHASLRALLSNLIDYAGLFPPASLPLGSVIENYERILASPESWLLHRLVLPVARLKEVRLQENWRVTLVVDSEPGPLPRQVETLETKLPHKLSLPTYCEAPIEQIGDGYAKLRVGSEPLKLVTDIAQFLCTAASRRMAFKATAGLHHAIPSFQRSPEGHDILAHGFLNLFVAAAFAWQGMEQDTIITVLEESDPGAFRFFDSELRWCGSSLTTDQIESTRRHFAHSFGSCSFEEPIADLHELGLLP